MQLHVVVLMEAWPFAFNTSKWKGGCCCFSSLFFPLIPLLGGREGEEKEMDTLSYLKGYWASGCRAIRIVSIHLDYTYFSNKVMKSFPKLYYQKIETLSLILRLDIFFLKDILLFHDDYSPQLPPF